MNRKLQSIIYQEVRMHIETDLDDVHAERLLQLQQSQNKPLAEIIADLIDSQWNQSAQPQPESEPSPIYQAFESAGLIGCIGTGEQLSATYKEKMDFSHKVGDATR